MLAIVAAIVFGFALLLDLFDTDLGAPDLFNWQTAPEFPPTTAPRPTPPPRPELPG